MSEWWKEVIAVSVSISTLAVAGIQVYEFIERRVKRNPPDDE